MRRVTPSKNDFIATYPLLLTAASVDIAVKATGDVLAGKIAVQEPAGHSVLRFPPPIWTWIWYGLARRIW